ncbi:MAG: alanine racemase [Acidobacteriota bacterium]
MTRQKRSIRPSRRTVLGAGGLLGARGLAASTGAAREVARDAAVFEPTSVDQLGKRLDPWIELDRSRYLANCRAISECAGGRPVIAVLKNDAYGLGLQEVAWILEDAPELWGFAVVRAEDALALRAAGRRKPILLMARHGDEEGEALARADVTLSAFADDDPERFARVAGALGHPIAVHLYVDTGLGRMGRRFDRISPWIEKLRESCSIDGAMTMLTSDEEFTREQVARFSKLGTQLRRGNEKCLLHVASSYPLLHDPSSRFSAVRPGILLHGSRPSGGEEERALIDVEVAFRLRAGVVRIERLPAGSTLGFSRFYTLEEPAWVATVPTGWGDGYPSAAENGAVALSGGRRYPVVNVNSNHANLLVGSEKTLDLGDLVTLMGFGDPAVTPEGLTESLGGNNSRQIDLKGYLPRYVA